MAEGEKDLLLRDQDRVKSTVLVVGHHGSRTSTTPEFLRTVSPKAAVISCRRAGRTKYPHPAVIRRLEKSGIPVFRTDADGAVGLATKGGPVDVTCFRTQTNQWILP